MRVEQFSDEYELIAPHYGMTASDLRARDQRQGQSVRRWYVIDEQRVVAAAVPWLRPDDRMFVAFQVEDVRAYRPLTETIGQALGRSVSTMCDDADREHLWALREAGFRIEMTDDRFVVPFASALTLVERAWVPSGYAIRSVSDVDEQRSFELDNQIRNLVPGTEGWIGDQAWFGEELRSPEFDPTAYLIAVEETTDSYVGLLRIWRNPSGPRLGLIGVLPKHRRVPIAAELLKQGLTAASTWGHDTFATETSPNNPHTYPRLVRMGMEKVGRFHQLTRP